MTTTTTFYQDVENLYLTLRGGKPGLTIPTRDWPLMEEWEQAGATFDLVARVMRRGFERNKEIGSIRYFDRAIREELARQAATYTGSRPPAPPSSQVQAPLDDFLEKVIAFLQFRLSVMEQLLPNLPQPLAGTVESIGWRLICTIEQIKADQKADVTALDTLFTEWELELYQAGELTLTKEAKGVLFKPIAEDFSRHQKRMDPAVFAESFAQAKLKVVLEHFDIPRLSTFYL